MLSNTPQQHSQCSATLFGNTPKCTSILPNAWQHSTMNGNTPQCKASLPGNTPRQHSPMHGNTPQCMSTLRNAWQHSTPTLPSAWQHSTPTLPNARQHSTATLPARQHSPMLGSTPRTATLPNARQHSPMLGNTTRTAALPAPVAVPPSPAAATATPAPQPSQTKVLAAKPRPCFPLLPLMDRGGACLQLSLCQSNLRGAVPRSFRPVSPQSLSVSQSVSALCHLQSTPCHNGRKQPPTACR